MKILDLEIIRNIKKIQKDLNLQTPEDALLELLDNYFTEGRGYKKKVLDFIKRRNERRRQLIREYPGRYRELAKKSFEKFKKRHPGRIQELMKIYYKKHKSKWDSRNNTRRLMQNQNPLIIPQYCKQCGKKKNLQIHHEVYPTKTEDIRTAVRLGKIYYLCKEHHYEKHRDLDDKKNYENSNKIPPTKKKNREKGRQK